MPRMAENRVKRVLEGPIQLVALRRAQLFEVGDIVYANREEGRQAQKFFGAWGKLLGVAGRYAGEDGEVVDCIC